MSDFEKYWEDNASKDSWANKAVAWNTWKEKQSKIDELEKLRGLDEMAINQIAHANQQWQLKCGELQKRVDAALQEIKGLERFTGEDCIADFEVLQGAVSHACKRLEKALRGAND